MLRSLLVSMGLVGVLHGCGDTAGSGAAAAGGQGAGGASVVSAAGAYVGDVNVQTDMTQDAIFASAEIEVASDGTVSGTITTKMPTATVGDIGSVSGTLSPADVASYQADLVLEWPSLGTFTAAGSLAYGESSGQLAGQLSARDEQGALVGSTVVALHQE